VITAGLPCLSVDRYGFLYQWFSTVPGIAKIPYMSRSLVVDTLAQLEREMASAGRSKEELALRAAADLVGRLDKGVLTIQEAAERLGMPERAIEEWIKRGGLGAVEVGGRWLVSAEEVARVNRLRDTLLEMDREGNPTDEEILQTYSQRPSEA